MSECLAPFVERRISQVPGTFLSLNASRPSWGPGTFRGTGLRATKRPRFGVNEDGYASIPDHPNFAACPTIGARHFFERKNTTFE
jgi:hypothetical protein